MNTLAPTAPVPTLTPVAVPRGFAVEFLVAQAMQQNHVHSLRLVHCRGLVRQRSAPNVYCPCDNGPSNCVTAVPLKSILFRLEGWLLAELYAGQCPYCRRLYWG